MNRPAIMGILNLTPDSFSGDGLMGMQALQRARQLAEDGADILDIGAESTRPGATALLPEQEWARLEPVLHAINDQSWRQQVRLSIDTRHSVTAARALDMGVDIVNDVGGLANTEMDESLEEHECDIVVMHALSIPADPAITLAASGDIIAEILQWKSIVTQRAKTRGLATHRLIYDPGIGFGKTAEQSLALINRAAELKQSGGRWLYGHSRKSFMKLMSDAPAEARDELTRTFSAQLAEAGIDYLRVHDVAGHVRMFDGHA